MIAVIFTTRGILARVVLETQRSVTAKWYSETCLPQAIQALKQLRPRSRLNTWLLHHHSAPANRANDKDEESDSSKNESSSYRTGRVIKAMKKRGVLRHTGDRNRTNIDQMRSDRKDSSEEDVTIVYCDYTASGRSLQFIEDYILREVLPCYGNTHTTTSITSLQSTLFRHEARDIIRNATHASEHDAVIFAGSGCTGAVHKLIHALDLPEPPVVFMGPYEHHSNLLPWREVGAKIVRIAETREGFLDLLDLEQQLQAHQDQGRQLIGCFSAASNVTGILADDIATTLLLHQYNALAFWDYAAAAPYVKLDVNPIVPGVDESSVYKDAVFFSFHKFIGGVQTPGVLIAKKSLFNSPAPEGCGGGSVFFVTRDNHRYLQDVELREEGGTAAIVESIRAGLVMQLKETVGVPSIMAREQKITRMVLSHVRTIPELILLGSHSHSVKRLPIFSFLVRHPRGAFLHHNFVCAVLNDVFGIQARGGCACAGPYAQDLLGINEHLAEEYETVLLEDRRLDRTHLRRHEEHSNFEMLRPGFARISLPYFMSDSEVAFVMEALKMVATEAWKLLPQYILNPETGEWRHHTNSVFRDRKWLGHIRYIDGKMSVNERRVSGQGTFPQDHADCLQTARNIFNKARKMAQRYPLADQCVMFDKSTDRLRWFMLPSEAQDLLLGHSQNVKHDVPFQPKDYAGSRGSISEGLDGLISPTHSPNGHKTHATSPRHSSLPCIEKHFSSSPALYHSPSSDSTTPKSPRALQPLHFAVGEEVNPAALLTSPPGCVPTYTSRTRCYSLGSSSNVSPPVLSPITMASLGIVMSSSGNKRSCSSQTDLLSLDHDLSGNTSSPMNSLGLLQLANPPPSEGRGSPTVHGTSQSPEDLQAYVKEVTKELATEIKSEIREVISKVQDVLSADVGDDNHCQTNGYTPQEKVRNNSGSSFDGFRGDSVSAFEVAEYLMDMSREMACKMKSEIREVVSAVDVLISPDNHSSITEVSPMPTSPEQSTQDASESFSSPIGLISNKLADLAGERTQSSECSSDETVIHVMTTGARDTAAVAQEDNVRSEDEQDNDGWDEEPNGIDGSGVSNKQCLLMRSTINSVSSQDSGINLTFQESDSSSPGNTLAKDGNNRRRKINLPVAPSVGSLQQLSRAALEASRKDTGTQEEHPAEGEEVVIPDNGKARWHCPPKAIWKPAVEALQEFDMIRDGDRVMVCLSGGKDSLSLLHTLHQYQFYARSKGIHFMLGAATVDPGSTAYDPRPLIPYLAALGVPYLYEEQSILEQAKALDKCKSVCSFCSRMKRGRLYAAARANGYNVLALGQHLDDLSESFLMSVFHNGRLRSMKAHYYIRERDLRVIRPFVYVREKNLRQFAESRNLPIIPENCPACFEAPKERHRSKQLLAQQEILFPKLFWSLRSALHPLISFRHTGEESRAYLRHRKHSQCHGTAVAEDDSTDTDEEPVV
ncbi:uncharacterized protein [Anabrus simplex]|uniref:uncharacterized protein n=1 Tax=Anabrus simplex TaxID=316456 RepID=UPI0035A31572